MSDNNITVKLPNTEGELKKSVSKEFTKGTIIKITFNDDTFQYGSLLKATDKYVTINRIYLIKQSSHGRFVENSVALNGTVKLYKSHITSMSSDVTFDELLLSLEHYIVKEDDSLTVCHLD